MQPGSAARRGDANHSKERSSDHLGGVPLRRVWHGDGGNTLKYPFMAMATDRDKNTVFIGKSHGTITMLDDCKTQRSRSCLSDTGKVEFER
jgi:hypothetical protein